MSEVESWTLHASTYLHLPEQPVRLWLKDPQPESSRPHTHDFSEIAIVLRGTGRHVLEDESWPISAGDVFVLQGDRPHDYVETCDLVLANLLFCPEHLGPAFAPLRELPGFHTLFVLEPDYRSRHDFRSRLRLTQRQLARVTSLIESIRQEELAQAPGGYQVVVHLFMILVIELCRYYERSEDPDAAALVRMGRVIRYIESHYREQIHVPAMAAMAGMSEGAFHRMFRRATLATPAKYLNNVRLRHAARLLRDTRLSVTEIAAETGFTDPNYFARRFRQSMRTSPSRYRATG